MKLFTKKIWIQYILYTFLTLIGNISFLAMSYSFAYIIDKAIVGDIISFMYWSIASCLFITLHLFLDYVSEIILNSAIRKINVNLRKLTSNNTFGDIYKLTLDSGEFLNLNSNKITQFETLYFTNVFYFTKNFFALILAFSLLAYINWMAMLVILLLSIFVVLSPFLMSKKTQNIIEKANKKNDTFLQTVKDSFNSYWTYWCLDIVEKLGNNINKDSEELEKENQRMRNIITTNSFINEFILFLGQVLLIILFSLFYLKGIITSIGLITTLYTIGSTYVFFGNNSLKSLLKVVSFTKIFKKEFIVKDSDLNNKKINKVVEFETICYEDLTFNHPNNSEKVIENFSLKINKGEKILISGKSGVGKTTLLKLLFNPYSRKSGKLKVNETYVEDFDLRSVATYVDQQIVLNKTSIMENINVNKKRVDLDKINYYLEALDLKKKVDSLPNGLDSLLEDNISNISGGEKQRLSIARALLSEKTFFFLDEITSALDKKTAKKCLDLFLKDKNKTVLMIVHDLDDSYIRMFDKVINL